MNDLQPNPDDKIPVVGRISDELFDDVPGMKKVVDKRLRYLVSIAEEGDPRGFEIEPFGDGKPTTPLTKRQIRLLWGRPIGGNSELK